MIGVTVPDNTGGFPKYAFLLRVSVDIEECINKEKPQNKVRDHRNPK